MSSTNDTVEEVPEEEVPAKKSFVLPEITSKLKSWELPEDLANFLQDRCQIYMTEKELEDFTTIPAPSNVKAPTKLDPFIKALVEKKGLNKVISQDGEHQKIHEKLYQVMGPLSSAWTKLQDVVNEKENAENEPESVLKNINEAIVLLGQVINKVTYERRLSILSGLNDMKQAKSLLKDNLEDLNTETKFLFGETFQKHVKTTAKAQESAEKLFAKSGSKRKWSATNRPNQQGLSPSYQGPRPSGGAPTQRGRGNWNRRGKKDSNLYSQGPSKGQAMGTRKPSTCPSQTKIAFSRWPKKDKYTSVCGKTEVFSGKLGSVDFRPENSRDCERVETSHKRQTSTMEGAKGDSNVPGEKGNSEKRDSDYDTEGCPERGTICKGPVSVNNFCEAQKGSKQISTNYQSKESEQLHALHPLQNGRDEKCVRPVESGRLHDKDRFEGCLLAYPNTPREPKVFTFSVGGKALRNVCSSFWSGTRSTNFHKIIKSTFDSPEETDGEISSLLGRPTDYRINEGRSNPVEGLCTVSASETWLLDKLGKIRTQAIPGDGVSRYDNKQHHNDSVVTKRKGPEAIEPLSGHSETGSNKFEKPCKPYRETASNVTCHINGTDAGESFTTGFNKGSTTGVNVRVGSETLIRIPGRAQVVGEQHNTEPRGPNENGNPGHSNLHRCLIRSRMGSFPGRREINRGSLDQRGEGRPPYKRVRTLSSGNSTENIFKRQGSQTSSYLHGQHDSIALFNPQRGDKISKVDTNSKKDMGTPQQEWDHDYCVLDPIKGKQNSGLEVETESQLQRMGIIRSDFSKTNKQMGVTRDRLFCIKDNEKTSPLHILKPRPRVPNNECSVSELGKVPISVSPILPNGQGSKNSQKSRNTESSTNSTSMARTTLVSNTTINADSRTNFDSSKEEQSFKSHARITPTSLKPNTSSCGISSVRKQLEEQGFSESASSIMVQARRASTTRAYKTPWRKWVVWCDQKQVDPFEAPVSLVVEFLSELYQKGLEYRTINVYRSAISAYHRPINGTQVGQIKEVCLLLSGIDNLRPPTPKYNVIWEVDEVLTCLKSLGPEENLSNKDLTLKTVMLMALTALKRCSDLHILDTRFMALGETKVVFKLSEKPKGFRRKGKTPEPVEFFTSGAELCPVSTIKNYIERTKTWREANSETKFFLSHINPHKAVTSSTIGRWLKTVLGNVGVDISKFTAHSTRSAASSKLKTLGASVQEIMNCGNWNSASTWQNFYHKPIVSGLEQAQKIMLQ